jgi:hypothetical protein
MCMNDVCGASRRGRGSATPYPAASDAGASDRPRARSAETRSGGRYRASAPITSRHHANSPLVCARESRRRVNCCSSPDGPTASSGPVIA